MGLARTDGWKGLVTRAVVGAWVCVGVGGWSAPPRPAGVAPADLTIRVNAFTASDQAHATVAVGPDGTIVAAWESRRQDGGTYGVYARALDGEGGALSPEVRVNTWSPGAQHQPAVAVGADAAWIVWTSLGQDGDGGAIMARRFGARLGAAAPEVRVNAIGAGNQHSPAIVLDESGGALVVWTDEPMAGAGRIFARLMAPDRPLTDEIRLDPGDDRDGAPCVAHDPYAGGFVAAWSRADAEGRPLGLVARRLDDRGTPVGGEFWLDGCGGVEPSLAVDHEGRLAVAWMAGGDDGYSVRARWFDGQGVPRTAAATIADAADGTASGAALAIDPESGRCVAAFGRADPEAGVWGVWSREFGHGGRPGPARRVGAPSPKDQRVACGTGSTRLAWFSEDRVAIAWSGDGGLGDGSAAHVTILSPDSQDSGHRPESVIAADGAALAPEDTPGPGPADLPPVWDANYRPQEPLGADASGIGLEFGFEGVPGTPWSPPDPDIAVGPDHIVLIANGQIAFFAKSGVNTFRQALGTEGNPGFWEPVGSSNFLFDPEVLYDHRSGRFWAMACERAAGSYFNLAVSDDGDPNGVWHKYRISLAGLAGGDIDSPNFAVDDGAVYLAADFFAGGDKHLVYMLPKAPLLAGLSAPPGTSHLIVGSQSYGMAQSHDSAPPPAQYLIHAGESPSNTAVTLHAIRDPLTGPTRVWCTVGVPTYLYPMSAPQLGSSVTITLFEARFWSCVHRGGSLWAAHHVRTPSTGLRAVVRWYEFAMNGWPASGQDPALRQWGEIDSGPTPPLHAYFPSIGVDADGNAAVTFARSGVSEFVGMWRAVRRWNDPPGTLRPAAPVRASTSPYTSYARWGDYSGTEPDPAAACALWGHHEFTTAPNTWRTWVARYRVHARADLNEDCALTIADFVAFLALFEIGDLRADFSADGALTIADFGAFQAAHAMGL